MNSAPGARPLWTGVVSGLTLAALLTLIATNARAEVSRCQLNAEQIYDQSAPKVLEVFSDAINQYRVNDRIRSSLGTGFLIKDGVVVTNFHVIAEAQRIELFDGTDWWNTDVLGVDPLLDIAVLKPVYYPADAPGIELAPTDSIRMGQSVFAIGFPRGLGKSITQGIVTGTDRVLADSTSSWLSPFLQTDATANPGNSGGPLLDDCGRVIGIVSRVSQPDISENIAFAIPVEVFAPVVTEIVATGHMSRAWHGLYGQMVEPAVLALMGVPQDAWGDYTGFLVETVEPGSAADRVGLRGGDWPVEFGGHPFVLGGDIITEVDGVRILDRQSALAIVRSLRVGQTIKLTYLRGEEVHKVEVTLEERPILDADLSFYQQ